MKKSKIMLKKQKTQDNINQMKNTKIMLKKFISKSHGKTLCRIG